MNIDPKFSKKWISPRKKKIDENVENKIVKYHQESFKINYFLYSLDKAIITFQIRFEQFKIYEDIFGFLFSGKQL